MVRAELIGLGWTSLSLLFNAAPDTHDGVMGIAIRHIACAHAHREREASEGVAWSALLGAHLLEPLKYHTWVLAAVRADKHLDRISDDSVPDEIREPANGCSPNATVHLDIDEWGIADPVK